MIDNDFLKEKVNLITRDLERKYCSYIFKFSSR